MLELSLDVYILHLSLSPLRLLLLLVPPNAATIIAHDPARTVRMGPYPQLRVGLSLFHPERLIFLVLELRNFAVEASLAPRIPLYGGVQPLHRGSKLFALTCSCEGGGSTGTATEKSRLGVNWFAQRLTSQHSVGPYISARCYRIVYPLSCDGALLVAHCALVCPIRTFQR